MTYEAGWVANFWFGPGARNMHFFTAPTNWVGTITPVIHSSFVTLIAYWVRQFDLALLVRFLEIFGFLARCAWVVFHGELWFRRERKC